jgi:hypothetical protein
MSTETHNGQAEHNASEHDGATPDTPAPMAHGAVVAQAAHAEVAMHNARIDQLRADRDRINAAIAVERAEVERWEAIIGWQTKTVKPRGKAKSPAVVSKKR